MDSEKLSFVDALRGIAILMVICIHHGQNFRDLPTLLFVSGFGRMGVQLFFVASAYTLCRSMDSRPGEPVRNFYVRRYFRIAPLYYVGIALYVGVAYVQAHFGGTNRLADYSAVNVAANIAFVHGFVPAANDSVVHGGWSIATEMLFYAAFPLLFMMFRRFEDWPKFPWLAVGAAVLVNCLIQLTIIYVLKRSGIANNSFLYYSILNQAPVFLIGMLLYFSKPRAASLARDVILMVLFGVASFACMNWPGHIGAMLSPTLAGLSFAFLFMIAKHFIRDRGAFARIGEVSYSMYIFHFVFAWWMTGFLIEFCSRLSAPPLLVYAGSLFLTVGLTYWIARFTKWAVEDRFIAIGRNIIRSVTLMKPAPASVAVPK
ncbi:acyltransferase [Bradyrhizobium diazoefficiens]|uniref:acyltransferase family protein n=1 Tax=Bradyrhizobium diazoefficiens TaxID=1355477 RepID=UPI00190D7A01|nr:acyltransferase [Bradyrhizobium diazoefficiens]MBK3665343.1 acyltransferase [Bradyrhizobium diazoefficiens]